MQMNYFRRATLAGRNVARNRYGVISGSIKRADPDGTTFGTKPYFKNLSAGDDLDITVQATPFTVTFTDPGLVNVIAAINTVLGANGFAFDADGALGLQSKTSGADSFIAVTGGTGADALGFDLIANAQVAGRGGELGSSPEAGVGNWTGTAFPRRGENFQIESVNRIAGRLAANADVLHSEHVRGDDRLKKIGTITGATNPNYWTVTPAETRIFNGLGMGLSGSTPDDFAPYALLIDTATKQIARSRIVGIVNGVPGAVLPGGNYAPTANFAAGDGLNFAGQDLLKVTAIVISEIRENRVIVAPGAGFATNKCVAGDMVELVGATNTYPWSHNGYRWVVEEVIDDSTIAVRPMSASEAAQVSELFEDIQPVLELNGEKQSGEVFGTVSVRTGAYTTNVTFVYDPPIPPGCTYEIWATVPESQRDTMPGHKGLASTPLARDLTSHFRTSPNAILSGFGISFIGASVTVAQGYMRVNDKIVSVPSTTFLAAAFQASGPNYIYWNEATGLLATSINTLPVASEVAENLSITDVNSKAHQPIALVVTASGVVTSAQSVVRSEAAAARAVTVGVGGQFASLENAMEYVNAWGFTNGEWSTGEPIGTYPHFDIILLSDITINKEVIISYPGVKIRAANPRTKVTHNAGSAVCVFKLNGVKELHLENFRVESTSDSSLFIMNQAGVCDFHFSGIRHVGVNQWAQLINGLGSNTGSVGVLTIEDCTFLLSVALVACTFAATHRCYLYRSDFNFVDAGFGGQSQFFMPKTGFGTAWPVEVLHIEACRFLNWESVGNANGEAFISISSGTPDVVIESNVFSFVNLVETNKSTLIHQSVGNLRFTGNVVGSTGNPINTAVTTGAGTPLATVSDNTIYSRPVGFANAAVTCTVADSNLIHLVDSTNVSNQNGGALRVQVSAIGNRLFGAASTGITNTLNSPINVIGNYVYLFGVNAKPVVGIYPNYQDCSVIGNFISLEHPGGSPTHGILTNGLATKIAGNTIIVPQDGFGIENQTQPSIITGNFIRNQTGTTVGYGIFTAVDSTIDGNQIIFPLVNAHGGIATTAGLASITGNTVKAANPLGLGGGNARVIGNRFQSQNFFLTAPAAGLEFKDNYVVANVTSFGEDCFIDGNHFVTGEMYLVAAGAGKVLWFNNNRVTGGFTTVQSGVGVVQVHNNQLNAGDFTTDGSSSSNVSGNYFNIVWISGQGQFTDNDVLGTFELNPGVGDLIISQNHFVSSVDGEGGGGEKIIFSENTVTGDFSFNQEVGVSQLSIVGNFFKAGVFCNGFGSATRTFSGNICNGLSQCSFTNCAVSANTFILDGGGADATFNNCTVSSCKFELTTGADVFLAGSTVAGDCTFDLNHITIQDGASLSNSLVTCTIFEVNGTSNHVTDTEVTTTTFLSTGARNTFASCIFTIGSLATLSGASYKITGTRFSSAVTVTVACTNFEMDSSSTNGIFTNNAGGVHALVSNCRFDTDVGSNKSGKFTNVFIGGTFNTYEGLATVDNRFMGTQLHVLGPTGIACDSYFTNCILHAVDNQANNTIVAITDSTVLGLLDFEAQNTNFLYLERVDCSSGTNLGANGSGTLSGTLGRLEMHSCRIAGATRIGMTGGHASISNNIFVGSTIIRGNRTGAGDVHLQSIGLTNNEFAAGVNLYNASYRVTANHFASFLSIGTSPGLSTQAYVSSNQINDQLQMFACYKGNIVGNQIQSTSSSTILLNGCDGVQVTGNWASATSATANILINAASGAVVRNSFWINIAHNYLQNTADPLNTTHCIKISDNDTAIVHGNFAYKKFNAAQSFFDVPWLQIEGTALRTFVGANYTDSGMPAGENASQAAARVQNNAGGNTWWFPRMTNVQDNIRYDYQHNFDGNVNKQTNGIG